MTHTDKQPKTVRKSYTQETPTGKKYSVTMIGNKKPSKKLINALNDMVEIAYKKLKK